MRKIWISRIIHERLFSAVQSFNSEQGNFSLKFHIFGGFIFFSRPNFLQRFLAFARNFERVTLDPT